LSIDDGRGQCDCFSSQKVCKITMLTGGGIVLGVTMNQLMCDRGGAHILYTVQFCIYTVKKDLEDR
jgi:hypothetical protein